MVEKYDIALKISGRELSELIRMYGQRLAQYQSDKKYVKWNAERLSALVAIGKYAVGNQDEE